MTSKRGKTHKEILPEHQVLMTAIGRKLKELRIKQNKGYVEMAGLIGVSKNEYNLIELGKIYFKISTLLRILDYHGISYKDFMTSI